jgi:putative phosphoribosyl transferase
MGRSAVAGALGRTETAGMSEHANPGRSNAGDAPGADLEREIAIQAGRHRLTGTLTIPASASAIVLFAHGSGSSRFSPRNRFVARVLSEAGLATLLLDLLEPGEESDRALVFDVDELASRLLAATRSVEARHETAALPVAYFGASTGAAAALIAAAEHGQVTAVVSRGGRPDLAASRLQAVRAPTLLIVGSLDEEVLMLNRRALALLPGQKELAIVPGATHLFEEPGTLDQVALLARAWFLGHRTRAR